jgi:hypothetical protein
MGLKISYDLKLKSASVNVARKRVTALRNFALTLPFKEVGELMEFQGEECSVNSDVRPIPDLSLKLRAARPAEGKRDVNDIKTWYDSADYMIGFETWPGEGSSPAEFGIGIHGKVEKVNDWFWHAYCKTQYASSPEVGGWENFKKCHLLVIQVLDEAKRLGFKGKVQDDGKYWKTRDLEELAKSIGMYNIFMAATIGSIKDAIAPLGYKTEAPITEYPNFEYLEAEGSRQSGKI